ncbi:MAG: lambda exonuclease family protein [Planctomycetota bacterium]
MKRNIVYCEQGTPEWCTFRLGRVTASHFSDVLSTGSTRKTYMMKLLAERMTGEPLETFSTKWMEEGNETEPQARDYYAELNGVGVEQVGFIELGDDIGCSPDGLVGDDGMVQIKCPFPSTHLGYILKGTLPSQYKAQVQGELWVADRQWSDFISFDARVKSRPYWSVRVLRDETYIKELEAAVTKFADELNTLTEKVQIPF